MDFDDSIRKIDSGVKARIDSLQHQLDKLKCDHPAKKVRCRVASNGSKMFKMQCVRCGETFGGWIPHSEVENKDSVEPIDDELRDNYRKSCFELEKALRDRISEVGRENFFEWYNEYLNSDEWRYKRRRVLMRCDGICEGCGVSVATIVHHLTYKNVGKEFLFELVGVCEQCHDRLHNAEE